MTIAFAYNLTNSGLKVEKDHVKVMISCNVIILLGVMFVLSVLELGFQENWSSMKIRGAMPWGPEIISVSNPQLQNELVQPCVHW